MSGPPLFRFAPTMNVLLRARRLLSDSTSSFEGAGVLVRDGRVVMLTRSGEESRRVAGRGDVTDIDLGDVVLAPGLVNAHAHLDLGLLHGKLPAGEGFVPWVGALLRARFELQEDDFLGAVRQGAERLLETGTTAVGDIDSSGAAAALVGELPLRARVYREVLDAGDASRRAVCEKMLGTPLPESELVCEGLSPHAPHTVSAELLASAVAEARRRKLALSIHWAESVEETRWLCEGEGPFRDFLGDSSGLPGLERLRDAGALDLPLSLVHANDVGDDELERVARAGIPLVHCPGTHRFFDRAPAPLLEWVRHGVPIALGTDSLASNDDLDMRREMALVAAAEPGLSPETILRWATEGGARALGMSGLIGTLEPAAWADLVAFDLPDVTSHAATVAAITCGYPDVVASWVAGEAR